MLAILTRGRPEENVLLNCKNSSGGGADTHHTNCNGRVFQAGGYYDCTPCHERGPS